MATIIKTPLNNEQILRLINVLEFTYGEVKTATLCEIKDTVVSMIDIEYIDGQKESFYPNSEKLEFILNGIKLERNA